MLVALSIVSFNSHNCLVREGLFWLFFLVGLGFEFRACALVPYYLNHTSNPFCFVILEMGVSWTSSSERPQILILLIPASHIARICRCDHQCPGKEFFFFFRYWGLNSGPTPQATPPALFCDGFLQDRASRTICPGWLWTVSLLISASWVARITGVSHWLPAIMTIS
jgi:hypothetical protein